MERWEALSSLSEHSLPSPPEFTSESAEWSQAAKAKRRKTYLGEKPLHRRLRAQRSCPSFLLPSLAPSLSLKLQVERQEGGGKFGAKDSDDVVTEGRRALRGEERLSGKAGRREGGKEGRREEGKEGRRKGGKERGRGTGLELLANRAKRA
jgi:hypothetical protein